MWRAVSARHVQKRAVRLVPHEGVCGPSPSTSEPQVLDCPSDSDRNAVIDACDEGEVTETLIPF